MAKYWIRLVCLILLAVSISEAWTVASDTIWAKSKYKGDVVTDKSNINWNNVTTSCVNTSGASSPDGSTSYIGISAIHNSDPNYRFQSVGRNNDFFMRTMENGAWRAWHKLWTDNNFNPVNYWHDDKSLMTEWNPLTGTKIYGIRSDEQNDWGALLLYRQSLSSTDTRLSLAIDGQLYCGNEGTPFTGVYKVWHAGNFDPATKSDTSTTNVHYTDYSTSSEVTGWSSIDVKRIRVWKVNKAVTVYFFIEGTSDNQVASFTVPDSIITDFNVSVFPYQAKDNGGYQTTPGAVEVFDNLFYCYKNYSTGRFTSSGTKGIYGTITYICK